MCIEMLVQIKFFDYMFYLFVIDQVEMVFDFEFSVIKVYIKMVVWSVDEVWMKVDVS